jgi:hypothetical protein
MVKGETSFAHRPTHEPIQPLVKGGCLMMGISTLNLNLLNQKLKNQISHFA